MPGVQAGKCFDVGEDVFGNHNNEHIPSADLPAQNKLFAKKVVEGLIAGHAMTCGTTDKGYQAGYNDATIAAGVIKVA